MSVYVDTSAVIAALVREPMTSAVRRWLFAQPAGEVFISDWTGPEVASALSVKVRVGALTIDQRAAAASTWQRLRNAHLHTLAVEADHFVSAARIADRHDLGIRAGDALHLAIAAAAPLLGVPLEPLD
ncbi:type II toxin-antitoxin system VapC family toxin [uncultured Sphingomonas sp.]|uniref:type II toxin-antitoxin system VapC family toxin n=1 Tax=uncultured Sphingomonas sp. TaxID=158754 RepID=UPI0025E2C542|nr:type II toxin-antitoxin system VapC family toxin [uncultured Sphingomonas sp.]